MKKLYSRLIKDCGDDFSYGDMPEEVQEMAPRNFLYLLLGQFVTKLGDALASAKIVLPVVMSSVGAPTFLIGLLVPLRESMSLIPQIFIGNLVQRFTSRKGFLIAGCCVQAAALFAIFLAALATRGMEAGVLILIFLFFFSIGRGFNSVSSKDIVGKTIPKSRRGRLGGLSASLSGLVSIGLGVMLFAGLLDDSFSITWVIFSAVLCWLIALCFFFRVEEPPGESSKQQSDLLSGLLSDLLNDLGLLKTDKTFRRFIVARSLLLSSALASPYFVVLAQKQADWQFSSGLGLFIIVSGLASFVSGKLWGKFADSSSRKVMVVTGFFTAILCSVSFFLIKYVEPNSNVYVALFFTLAVIHEGVRLGRKTYVLDIEQGNQRTRYVTVGNTIIGILLLIFGLLGAGIAQLSITTTLGFFAISALAATVVAIKLPEA